MFLRCSSYRRCLKRSNFCYQSVTNSSQTPWNRAFLFSVLGSEHAARHAAARRDAGRRSRRGDALCAALAVRGMSG